MALPKNIICPKCRAIAICSLHWTHTRDIFNTKCHTTNIHQIQIVTFRCRHRGTRRYSCAHFQPSRWRRVSGQRHVPTAFPPGMSPGNNCGGRILGRRTSVQKRLFLHPLGFEPRRKLQYHCAIWALKNIGTGKSVITHLIFPKPCSYVNYWTTADERSGKWQSKNTTIFVGTIIYQLHVSAVIGHLQVGIQCQRKNIYYKYRYVVGRLLYLQI